MAMTIKELREKRKKAWDTARDFLDSKRNANGVLSEEDSKIYDAMEQTIVDLGKEIQRLERQAEIEAEMNKATSTPVLGKPARIIGCAAPAVCLFSDTTFAKAAAGTHRCQKCHANKYHISYPASIHLDEIPTVKKAGRHHAIWCYPCEFHNR